MAALPPLLPLLAAISGEASALEEQGADAAMIESLVRSRLEAPEHDAALAMGGPDENEEEPAPPPPVQAPAAPGAPGQADQSGIDADEALIDGRRRPGRERRLPGRVTQENPGAVRAPPPEAFPGDPDFPIPDRWRLAENLGLVRKERFFDPYGQNTYKGDRAICIPSEEEQERRAKEGKPRCKTPKLLGLKGDDWFLALTGVSDTIVEPRSFPQPVGVQTTQRPGSIDVFGRQHSLVAAQTFIVGASLFKGSTAFKPPEIEYKVALAYNVNFVDVSERRILFVEPSKKSHRLDHFLGVQELFVDYHLRNVSDRYDFDSLRVGIQPFQMDFRGFLFNDQQLGIRLFGNRDNNRFQYNLAAIWRLEKDTNSGLNSVAQRPRDDWILHANLFRQDFPEIGMTSQISATLNINRERDNVEIDDNGFPVRPALLGTLRGRNYDVAYLGYSMDGHFGRLNLTTSFYAALGSDRRSFFTGDKSKIRAWFAAAEPSYDLDWIRVRLSGLYASGDGNPYDKTERGFDAIFENPIFAGADTSYWIRQTIPFAGGGRVIGVNGRNGILNSLRSSKEQGQSNFNNPGTILLGAGADFDLTPALRVSANANRLWFAKTDILQALRVEGSIPKSIGWDVSGAAIWRPTAIQNVVFRLSGALLQPGKGFKDLFANAPRDKRYYSVLFNATLTY